MERRERRGALIVSAVVIVAVAGPGVLSLAGRAPDDSFPMSTYPMFSRDRGQVVELATVVGIDGAGREQSLSPSTIAGTDQVIQAVVTVDRAIAGGAASATALCRSVAARVDPATTTRIEVVVEQHDVIAWSSGARRPLDRRLVTGCAVQP